MRRLLPTCIAVLAPLGVAAEAAGKVALEEARVCGGGECATQTAQTPGETPHTSGGLPFELFAPTIEIGRRVAAPAAPGPHYQVTLTTQPVAGSRVISLSYFPESGYMHVLGEPGSEAGGALLNTGWVRLTAPERHAYDLLAARLTPDRDGVGAGGGDQDNGVGAIVQTAGAILAVGMLGLILVRRRRAASATPAAS